MASLIAGQLEGRNVGSNITFEWEGARIHGKIGLIEKHGTAVDLTLETTGETYELTVADPVEVFLSSEAQFANNTRNAIEQLIILLRPTPDMVAA